VDKKILMVLTRDVPNAAQFGRERTIAFIRDALKTSAELSFFRVRSLLEDKSMTRYLEFIKNIVFDFLRGKPRAIQVSLFSNSTNVQSFLNFVASSHPDAIYFDGIRCLDYLLAARKSFPEKRLVCDIDDLMSRRMKLYRKAHIGTSAGYLKTYVPNWVQHYILDGLVGSFVQVYEEIALKQAEKEALEAVNLAVLVSVEDARVLRSQIGMIMQTKVKVIPPYTDLLFRLRTPEEPLRFVFIGSDSLMQNYLPIKYLLDAWKRLQPATPLHIYGKMTRIYPDVPGIYFQGFAEKLSEVYAPGSIALCPATLGGGIKTKILEAISYGVIPVGTPQAFEGIDLSDNDLAMNPSDFERFLVNPVQFFSKLEESAYRLRNYCENIHSSARIQDLWQIAMCPSTIREDHC